MIIILFNHYFIFLLTIFLLLKNIIQQIEPKIKKTFSSLLSSFYKHKKTLPKKLSKTAKYKLEIFIIDQRNIFTYFQKVSNKI